MVGLYKDDIKPLFHGDLWVAIFNGSNGRESSFHGEILVGLYFTETSLRSRYFTRQAVQSA